MRGTRSKAAPLWKNDNFYEWLGLKPKDLQTNHHNILIRQGSRGFSTNPGAHRSWGKIQWPLRLLPIQALITTTIASRRHRRPPLPQINAPSSTLPPPSAMSHHSPATTRSNTAKLDRRRAQDLAPRTLPCIYVASIFVPAPPTSSLM